MVKGSTKLTPELIATISRSVQNGAPVLYATLAAGVPRSTYYQWQTEARLAEIKRDRKELLTPKERLLLKYLDDTLRAKARVIERNIAVVQVQAPKDWRAAWKTLEAFAPEEFGPATDERLWRKHLQYFGRSISSILSRNTTPQKAHAILQEIAAMAEPYEPGAEKS
jgi:hypothetical protein